MNRLLGTTAVALIVVGGATASAPPTTTGGFLDSRGSAATSAPASSLPSPQSQTTPAPPPVRVAPEVMVRNASLRAPRQLPAPARIRYPGIGADMSTTDVGVADDATMEIPDDAAVAGWYRYSAAPAEASGSTIIAAHAGSIPTPRGPLYDLREARVGQLVEILDREGARTRWRVTRVERLLKKTLDLRPYFSRSGDRKMVLFTCGGRWDPARQSYDDNIIVTATPAR